MNRFILYLILITILFTIYIEYSVENVIWREGVKGAKEFRPVNIIHYLVNPLHNHFLWKYQLLDINYIVFVVISTILYFNVDIINNIVP